MFTLFHPAVAEVKKSGIYSIRCNVTDRQYIGSAANIKKRINEHRAALIRGDHHSKKLQNAWNKYGAAGFSYEVVEEVADVNALLDAEQRWIDRENSCKAGLNVAPRAEGLRGFVRTAEHTLKIAESNRGKRRGAEVRDVLRILATGRPKSEAELLKLSEAGKRHGMRHITAEHRALANERRRGSKHTPETRAKISAGNRGKKLSPEHAEALRQASIGRKPSEETRRKLSESHKGKTCSPETAQKIAAANRGKKKPPRTAEHAQKIAVALRARYAEKFPEKARALAAGVHPSTIAYQWRTNPEAFKAKWSGTE